MTAALPAVLLVMAIVGHGRYTSLGMDLERRDGLWKRYTYYRLRWPGDGSIWVGGESRRSLPTGPLDRFDWGGRFFKSPRPPVSVSAWNRRGFWLVHTRPAAAPPSEESGSRLDAADWVGVPEWAAVAVASMPAVLLWVPSRRRSTIPPLPAT